MRAWTQRIGRLFFDKSESRGQVRLHVKSAVMCSCDVPEIETDETKEIIAYPVGDNGQRLTYV
jgi:hypothetical protein